MPQTNEQISTTTEPAVKARTRVASEQRRKARQFSCPRCQAVIGEPCLTVEGEAMTPVHSARAERAGAETGGGLMGRKWVSDSEDAAPLFPVKVMHADDLSDEERAVYGFPPRSHR